MTVFDGLLVVHVVAGSLALATAGLAFGAKAFGRPHRTHVRAGRTFFVAMVVIFATAIPMSVLRGNTFLFLIAVFSFYLALVGWRLARNRTGTAAPADWLIAGAMALVSAAMIVAGAMRSNAAIGLGPVLTAFGGIAAFLVFRHIAFLRGDMVVRNRIALHLTMMLSATIATLTAFVVVNFRFLPQPIAWFLPTALIAPLIVAWRRRALHGLGRGVSPPG